MAVSSLCSGEIVHLKILQSDWWRPFWTIYQEQDLSQIKDLCMALQIIKIFIIEQIQRKLMTIFFFKFKKPYFWPIFGPFPKFLQQKILTKNQAIIHNFVRVLAPSQNSEKSNDPIPRKHPDRC